MRILLLFVALACTEASPAPPWPAPSSKPGISCIDCDMVTPRPFTARQERALRAAGFKDAKASEYSWFGCSDSDSILTSAGFRSGEVTGNVCCGILKGCVVRTQ